MRCDSERERVRTTKARGAVTVLQRKHPQAEPAKVGEEQTRRRRADPWAVFLRRVFPSDAQIRPCELPHDDPAAEREVARARQRGLCDGGVGQDSERMEAERVDRSSSFCC